MSSPDGLEILKNWQITDTTVKVLSRDRSMARFPFEIPAKIVSVDGSDLVLRAIESGETAVLDISKVEFSMTRLGGALALQIKFHDDTSTVLTEELP